MASPPSYKEAVGRPDWLDLVLPYLSYRQYAVLCLVSKRFYAKFAPLLWADPLRTARSLGLIADEEPTWLLFFKVRAREARLSTRCMVLTWDARHSDPCHDCSGIQIQPWEFPKLRCFIARHAMNAQGTTTLPQCQEVCSMVEINTRVKELTKELEDYFRSLKKPPKDFSTNPPQDVNTDPLLGQDAISEHVISEHVTGQMAHLIAQFSNVPTLGVPEGIAHINSRVKELIEELQGHYRSRYPLYTPDKIFRLAIEPFIEQDRLAREHFVQHQGPLMLRVPQGQDERSARARELIKEVEGYYRSRNPFFTNNQISGMVALHMSHLLSWTKKVHATSTGGPRMPSVPGSTADIDARVEEMVKELMKDVEDSYSSRDGCYTQHMVWRTAIKTFIQQGVLIREGRIVQDQHHINVPGTRPLMLSVSHCSSELPATFFKRSCFRNLVYLDISYMPGLFGTQLAQASLGPGNLPCLRILKARGREIDDNTAALLFRTFKDQLRSLDLGRNRLTDGMVSSLLDDCFPEIVLTPETRFEVEGRIDWRVEYGSDCIYQFVIESAHSALFNHPLRYFADPPVYTAEGYLAPQEAQMVRSDGRADIVDDDVDWVKEVFMDDKRGAASLDMGVGARGGLSLLRLDGNKLSVRGLERLLRLAPGPLQLLECGSVSFPFTKTSFPPWMGDTITISGCAGLSYVFRPVFAPNLQALSIHHSLVTNVLSIETGRLGTMADTWLSEKFLFPGTRLAYPLPFVPDMNPRLLSLTLTGIPRYSSGPIIQGLISLLKHASAQERAIEEAKGSARRGPLMLRGLRRIRLEFQHDADASEGLASLSDGAGIEIDSEVLASMAAKEFSFFGDAGWASRSESNVSTGPRPPNPESRLHSDRLTHYPFIAARNADGCWVCSVTLRGRMFNIPVWIGPDVPTPHAAVNAYMRRVGDRTLNLADIVPATPCHVAAGVPPGSYISNAAWADMATNWNNGHVQKPTKADLDGMQDVVVALKAFRAQTKRDHDDENVALGASHFHWTGKLELSLPARHQSK